MKTFYNVLLNTLVASVTNSFLWFALTFWAYLETQSVIVTGVIGGSFMILASLSALFFGSFVDHHKKKTAMLVSSVITLVMYSLAGLVFFIVPQGELLLLTNPVFWLFVLFILAGAVAGNMRGIALSTVVTLLVPENGRDKANGLVGTVNGIAFAITSVFSGLVIGFLGFNWALGIAVTLTFVTTIHLLTVKIPETLPVHPEGEEPKKHLDLRGTIKAISSVPGLFGLIIFATFNNLLGGSFMALMDAYGLSLVSVEVWGMIWGVLSFGFIVGGLIVAKKGLSNTPLRTLMFINIVMWTICIFFTMRSSIVLTSIGIFMYMCLIPIVEAAEQTIMQRLVPLAKQGRVFGFAQSIESAASPVMAFIIGPVTQLFFIPYMTTGSGAQTLGPWLGEGPSRGIALVFIVSGLLGLIVTILALNSKTYKTLASSYAAKV